MNIISESAQAQQVLDVIRKATAGTEYDGRLYMAGGFVRDELLGRKSKDVDFLVTGGPNSGLEAAEFIAKRLGIYKDGSNPVIFPTYYTAKLSVPINTGTQEVEFVAPRKEKYQKGSRKPDVAPGEIQDDVMRRDFTVNSLLKNLHTGEILDFSGRGQQDLKKGILDTTGDPNVIFGEDPLRILRAIRFAIKYNFKLPLRIIKSIKRFSGELHNISTERINDEINKILVLDNPSRALTLFRITGILEILMPELHQLHKLKQNAYHKKDALGHTLDVLDASSPELTQRLAALFHDIGKAATKTEKNGKIQFIGHAQIGADIAENIMRRLKYPTALTNKVSKIVKNHMDLKSAGPEATELKDSTLRKFVFRVGDVLDDLLSVIHADNISHSESASMPQQIEKIRERLTNMDINKILNTKSVLDGNQIRALGAQGPEIAKIKDRILLKSLENPDFSERDATQLAKNMIQHFRRPQS